MSNIDNEMFGLMTARLANQQSLQGMANQQALAQQALANQVMLGQQGFLHGGAGGFGAPGVVGPGAGAQGYNPPQDPPRPRDKTLREELQSETDEWLKGAIEEMK